MFAITRATALAAATTLLAGGAVATAAPTASAASAAPSVTQARVVNAHVIGARRVDRIVIDVLPSLPADITVQSVKTLVYDGSGKKVPLRGKYFLRIVLHPAVAHNNKGKSIYRGPTLARYNLTRVKGFAMTGDFEGYVSFGVALDKKTSWTTHRLKGPARFEVDIRH